MTNRIPGEDDVAVEINDPDLAQVESCSWYEEGVAVYSSVRERKMALRIRRLEKQYAELLEAAGEQININSQTTTALENERTWTKALTEDCGKLIKENDVLRTNAGALENMYRKVLHVLQVGPSSATLVNMILKGNAWEKE